MTFLPQKFRCTQENTRTHLPPHHIRPLIDLERQVAIRLHPSGESLSNNRFRSRANYHRLHQRTGGDKLSLFILFKAGMRHNRTFLGKAIYMLCLLSDITYRYQHREISILHVFRFYHTIKCFLDIFPQGVTVRFDNHATAHRRIFSHIRRPNNILIPLRKIFQPSGSNGSSGRFYFFSGFSHGEHLDFVTIQTTETLPPGQSPLYPYQMNPCLWLAVKMFVEKPACGYADDFRHFCIVIFFVFRHIFNDFFDLSDNVLNML